MTRSSAAEDERGGAQQTPETPGAIFGYYKEVLRPDLFTSIASDLCNSAEGVCVDSPLGPEWPMALPPVPVDADVPFKLRNNLCGPLTIEPLSAMANEHDFLQFFHAIATQGAPLDIREIDAVLRTSCNGRQVNCPIGGRPDQCEACNGICTHDPCADTDEPTSCGRLSYSGTDGYALPDLLRWAPITPDELDGDPSTPDVLPNMVSLVDGARRYLEQRYGPLSDQLEQLEDNGLNHGITSDLSP
jgi:hypothetical protein